MSTTKESDIALGCRLNAYEAAVMRALADRAGLSGATIVNTCAVTAAASRESRAAARRAARAGPVVVTGCAAAMDPDSFSALSGVVRVVGNAQKLDPATWGLTEGPTPTAEQVRARPIVQAQGGCDHACTFCVTTIARGPASSRPTRAIVDEVRALVSLGAHEVVLSGVDLASWRGGRARLGDLVRHILRTVPDLGRLRLSSLDPAALDETLWETLEREARLCPHLHLSVQAGDDAVLKRMARRHRRADILDIAARARGVRPDVALAADLIAGFPGEDDAAFAHTLSLVREAGFAFCHVFAYSPRPGTAAARMAPQVPHAVRRRRAAVLRAEGDRAGAAFLEAQKGRRAVVVVEEGGQAGRTEHFVPVALDRPAPASAAVRVVLGRALPGGRVEAQVVA
ncbi:MAG TPA: tRNA (N(6)-L-threonylcarbamoyladenosine(37)-C(2))-methylthiotransferase MtaB [Rhodospirillaceae bacterium]|jgi:threonylcarbamoyladenosine tRNA methylthiotransferase MtaB|nr:MiaB/RimO family radical SAM methylthiotransferase [Alphaproteobacteria bacterium]HBH26378.1 tRNA (N(6)-L-threonylcarbamoyladenosine(37)-C(2))-methylthiotransferase MtaB [Rhodospirillaceae bacterium]